MNRCVCRRNSAAVAGNYCGRLGDTEVLLELENRSFNIIYNKCLLVYYFTGTIRTLCARRAACCRAGPVTIYFAEQEFDFLESFRIAGQST